MSDSGYQHLSLMVGALIAIAIGAVDVWHFHAFPIEVDGALLAVGLTGLGLKSVGIPAPK